MSDNFEIVLNSAKYIWWFFTISTLLLLLVDIAVCTIRGRGFTKDDWIGSGMILIGALTPVAQWLLMYWLIKDIKKEWSAKK